MAHKKIGRYEIRDQLGEGGMGTVYLAYDPTLEREVALKVLQPHLYLQDPDFSLRFKREVKAVASLEHGSIVSLYDFGEEGEWLYYVMRLMKGGTLKERIAGGPLSLDRTVSILRRVGGALDRAHQHGVVHRDLKPANILFDEDGDAYLSDFGIVKIKDGSGYQTRTGERLGTPLYMSPEQLDGHEIDGRSDIYSLGVVLYEMLSGGRPYDHESDNRVAAMHYWQPVPKIVEANPNLPSGLQSIIDQAMAKNPAERYATASELTDAAAVIVSGQSIPQSAPVTVDGTNDRLADRREDQFDTSRQPNTANIRRFLVDNFTNDQLTEFCFDYFLDLYRLLEIDMSRTDKVQSLLTYCLREKKMPDLIAALNRERPMQYKKLFVPTADSETPSDDIAAHESRQIFISHAYQDREVAQKLANDLREQGWQIWIMQQSIQPGEKFAEAISRGLEESEIFVVLLSKNAVNSQWVRLESNAAIDRSMRGKLQFIPLEIESVELPVLWTAYQRISFVVDYSKGLNALLTRLEQIESAIGDLEVDDERADGESTKSPMAPKELLAVPAGPFLYGEDKQEHFLPEFRIARTLVTNAEYADFVKSTNHRSPAHWAGLTSASFKEIANHPVVYVTWDDAVAYAEWAGKVVPTEEEWEKAARGTDGRDFPWGNEIPTTGRCNIGYDVGGTTPVGKYSPQGDSPYGCADMAGNVWEWTSSWYDQNRRRRVLRGGAFRYLAKHAKSTYRDQSDPSKSNSNTGFRIVESSTPIAGDKSTTPERGNE